MVQKDIW